MSRRKKYPKLPNGFGSIKYLGKNRTNPYGVYPPTKEFDEDGRPVTQKALAYVDDWYYGFSILTAYKAGTYIPGIYPPKPAANDEKALPALVASLLADYSRVRKATSARNDPPEGKTFEEVYQEFWQHKYEAGKKQYSDASKNSTRAAFRNCSVLHKRIFKELRYADLQKVVDDCPLKHASLELIVSLFHQMYDFADLQGYAEKDYSAHVRINIEDDDEHGIPFSDDELRILWEHKDNPAAELLLIMCYSGYRIAAYRTIKIDLDDRYFKGGVKTKASKDRIVPIHSAILPLVRARIQRNGGDTAEIFPETRNGGLGKAMRALLPGWGISTYHTPHDCRHTFSSLCERYKVNENDRKRMLGHSFGTDITNRVYGHRSLEDLRTEIEKIRVCC